MQKNSAQRAPVPTESVEQQLLFRWARFYVSKYSELALLYHIPNGGSRRKSEAGRFKAEGVKAGVPDLFLPAARENFHGLYIEMKRKAVETLGNSVAFTGEKADGAGSGSTRPPMPTTPPPVAAEEPTYDEMEYSVNDENLPFF